MPRTSLLERFERKSSAVPGALPTRRRKLSAYAVRGAAPAAVDGVALVASEAMTSSIRHASMRQLPGPLGVTAFGEDGQPAAIVEGDGACQRTREAAKDVGGNNRPGAPVA
ncbi:MAG: hypothetical protein M0014_11350, partial [Actinomycetota bacterium]|nr:hypothetical protein [Actinomycetota bacterium]